MAPNGRLLAAVLACGKGAFLSHWSAAHHWGILSSSRATVDVASPTRTGRGREGISIHRCGGVIESDVAVVAGIPCSTVARTLLDLAAVMRRDALERACEQAEILRLFDLRAVLDVLERAGRRRGAGRLRRLLSQPVSDVSGARSELERRFLDLCRRTRLPAPAVNVWVPEAALEADFVWPQPRLVVEVDGYRFHRTRQAFERDHDRDQRLTLAGYHVLRFGWSQVIGRPRAVAASIRTALDRPSRLPP